jgi:lipopolysaccharide transport system permease protein
LGTVEGHRVSARSSLPEPVTERPDDVPTLVIQPSRGWVRLELADLWRYRQLIVFLAWRDISVRYKQTVLGIAWVVLQPLLLMVVFTVVFGMAAGMSSGGIPYPLFVYAGLVPWQFFSRALGEVSNSVVANERLITKVYFPRLAIPLATVLAGALDLVITLILLAVLLVFFRTPPSPLVWLLPGFLGLTLMSSLGVGLWLAALNVQFRDVRYTLPFLTQLLLFTTPIAYSTSALPPPWSGLLGLNPMTAAVEGFRWSLLGAPEPSASLIASVAASAILLVSGLFYFRRMERRFADII